MRIVPGLAVVAAGLLLSGAAASPSVDYSLSPVFEGETLKALSVEMRFTGDADGETRFSLPDTWGGEAELWKHVSGLTVSGGAATADDPRMRTVRHRPGAVITVRYRLDSGYAGDPPVGNPYRPIVRPGWFHVLGEATFAEPEGRSDLPARFRWKGWPRRWKLASDLDHARLGRPMRVGDVQESVSVGSPDLKMITRPIAGGVARIALIGDWKFDTGRFGDLLARIVSAQRGFWNDLKEPYFVTLVPTPGAATQISLGGTGRADAFALFATGNADEDSLAYLIAHEHSHTWIPRRIGRMPNPDEAQDYWLSEGFTDFYTYRTLLRAGIWSLEDFARYANESLGAYDVSPVRTAPNSRIVADFWRDYAVEKLPYQRGMQLAFHWDDRVRTATNGARDLDDVLLLMRDRQAAARTREDASLVRPAFVRAMKDVAGIDVAADIARHVDAGEPVDFPTTILAGCATLAVEKRRVFERGWDPEATGKAGNVVTGLKLDSPAYKAGLRDGMKILKREAGKVGDARVEYALRVVDGGVERVIRFMPEGRESYIAREIVIAPDLDETARKACAARIGGQT